MFELVARIAKVIGQFLFIYFFLGGGGGGQRVCGPMAGNQTCTFDELRST